MKMPRRRFWLPLLLVVASVAFVQFDVHYHVIGWWRGDAYYKGLPTSYWRNAATFRIKGSTRPWLETLYRFVRLRPSADQTAAAIFAGDPDSAKVVAQLLNDGSTDPDVRDGLLNSLAGTGAVPSDDLATAVRPSLNEPRDSTRYYAACYLLKSDRDRTTAMRQILEVFGKWGQDSSPHVRSSIISHIVQLTAKCNDVDRPALLAILRQLEGDSNSMVRERAAQGSEEISKFAQ